jgi:hypothetical protein
LSLLSLLPIVDGALPFFKSWLASAWWLWHVTGSCHALCSTMKANDRPAESLLLFHHTTEQT